MDEHVNYFTHYTYACEKVYMATFINIDGKIYLQVSMGLASMTPMHILSLVNAYVGD